MWSNVMVHGDTLAVFSVLRKTNASITGMNHPLGGAKALGAEVFKISWFNSRVGVRAVVI